MKVDGLPKNSKPVRFSMECTCGGTITEQNIAAYPHDGGVRGEWIYFHCTKCGYEWSWWKVERRVGRAVVKDVGA